MKKPKLFAKQIPSKDIVDDITNAIVTIYSLSPKEYSSNLFHDLAVGFKSLIHAMDKDREDSRHDVPPLFIKWCKLYVWLQHQINPKDEIRSKFESKIPVCTSYILASLQYQNSIANYHQNIMELFLSLFESAQPNTIQNIVNLDIEIIALLWMPVEFVGDYITQRQCLKLIVAVLKHLNFEERRKKVFGTQLNEELQKLILKLAADPNNFEEISRELLNSFNMDFSRNSTVFSVYCTKAVLESSEIFKPEKVSQFWIDFNYTSKTVSLLCQLNQSERKQEELYVKIKIDKLQMINQFDCSVFSIEPAIFSTDVSANLKYARVAVFSLPKTQVERLKAASDLFDYYNSYSSEHIVPTPNTIEQYLLECSDDSPQTPHSVEDYHEIPKMKSPRVKIRKNNSETKHPIKDSNQNQSINLTFEDMPMANESTSQSRVIDFVNQSVRSNKESGYNTTIFEDRAVFKKPEIPPFKTKRNVKASSLLEPKNNISKLSETNPPEEPLAPIKKVPAEKKKNEPRMKKSKSSYPNKQIKLPASNEETGPDSLLNHQTGGRNVLADEENAIELTRPEETVSSKAVNSIQQHSNANIVPAAKQLVNLPKKQQILRNENCVLEKPFQVQRQENEKTSIRKSGSSSDLTSKPHQSNGSRQPTKEGKRNHKSINHNHVVPVNPTKQIPLLLPQPSCSLVETNLTQQLSDTKKQPKSTRKSCPKQNISASILEPHQSSIVQSKEQESFRNTVNNSHCATKSLGSIVNPIQKSPQMSLPLPQLSKTALSTPKSLANNIKASKPEDNESHEASTSQSFFRTTNPSRTLPRQPQEKPKVSEKGNMHSSAESTLRSSNCEPSLQNRPNNLDAIVSQLPQNTNRRFFKTNILRASISAAKANSISRKKTEPPTQQKVIEKPKCVNRVKPLNYPTKPEETAQENHIFGQIESNMTKNSAAGFLKEQQKNKVRNLRAVKEKNGEFFQHDVFENPDQDYTSKGTKRRSRKRKTLLKDVEISKVVPYSVWKIRQKKKNNSNESTMPSPAPEQENEVVLRSTRREKHRKEEICVSKSDVYSTRKISKKGKNNDERAKILPQRLERANGLTESLQASSDPFDQLKKLNSDNKITRTGNNFAPLACSSSSSSVSNGNYIVADSDEEVEREAEPIQGDNEEQISRWIEMVREDQPQQIMLSPVTFPSQIAQRSTRTKSRETILTPVKMSLDLDDFSIVSPSQPQNDSNRRLQNMSTSNMSPVYEILDDEIPVDQLPIDDDPLEEISHIASPASKHFSGAEPVDKELPIHQSSLQSQQHEISRDDDTQSEEISLMPSNSEIVEEFLQETFEQQPTSSHGSIISVYETSETNDQECSAFRVQQNVTNQLIVQHHHYVMGPTRKRINSSECSEYSEASPAKMSALTKYTPLKGYDQLLPTFIQKLTTEKDRVFLELEKKLQEDIFENINVTFEAVTKSISFHETAFEEDQGKALSLLEKLEWHQKSLQESQLELEKIHDLVIRRTEKSLNEEEKIEKMYKEAEEALKTYADDLRKEQWQCFSKDIIDSISKRLTRLSNI